MSIKDRFSRLTPFQKNLCVWSLVGAGALFIVVVGYKVSRSPVAERARNQEKTREISLEPDLIQKTMLREQRKEIEAMQAQIAKLTKSEENRSRAIVPPPPVAPKSQLPEIPSADQVAHSATTVPPYGSVMPPRYPAPPPVHTPPPPKEEEKIIGGIGILSSQNPTPSAAKEPADKKKAERTVYLPPSFMEAMLLTGFDASTSGEGKNNPEPLLLRIQAPAVLPNDVKANLRGCFIIAEAVGKLNKERADVRLVSLSCIGRKGQAVIDATVKGFVTDSDSKVGLSGRVVSKMGAATARAVVAGIFGGAGNALQASTITQSTTALGSTSVVNADQLTKSAAGGGLAEGSKTLHDLYLDLAKQATPVIEVGAAKKVTVVVSEGKELAIKNFGNEAL
ncbi:MAG: TraB/VirB10 family protein [Desulfobacteraceae bacterium]|nr:TraB/VirB10 family protein [Desulfobacteraceae bacterium]